MPTDEYLKNQEIGKLLMELGKLNHYRKYKNFGKVQNKGAKELCARLELNIGMLPKTMKTSQVQLTEIERNQTTYMGNFLSEELILLSVLFEGILPASKN